MNLYTREPHFYLFLMTVLVTLLLVCCDTKNSIQPIASDFFLKYYGEDGDQTAVDLLVNGDGSFVILAQSSVGQGIYLIKADSKGNVEWQRKFGTAGELPKDIEWTPDGNYIILSEYQETPTNKDIKLLRINDSGVKLDSVVHGTDGNDIANSITSLSDNGYIIAGSTDYNPDPKVYPDKISSFLHFRCDASLHFLGNSIWNDIDGYGEKGSINVCTKIMQYPDSNKFYVFGYSNTISFGGNSNTKLVYYSLDNDALQGKTVGFQDYNENIIPAFITAVPSTLLKGYFVVSTANGGTDNSKLRVSKLKYPLLFDINNDKQFDQNIIGARKMSGVSATPSVTVPEGYLVVSNEMGATGQLDILLSKINQSGDEVWSVGLGGSSNDTAAAVAELPDGKIVVLATVQLDAQFKIALMKLNSKGEFLN